MVAAAKHFKGPVHFKALKTWVSGKGWCESAY